MRVPKLLIFFFMLGAAIISYIAVAVHSEVEMLHAFDASDKKTETAAGPSTTDASAESSSKTEPTSDSSVDSSSDTDTEPTSDTSSESPPESSSISASTTEVSDNVETKDTYSKLVAPSIKAKNGKSPRLDIAFCIDTTSSMQGEIDTVKAKVKSMVTKIGQSKQHPIVRVGLVAYRDNGDDYVTKVFQFSGNIDDVVKAISDLAAEGGGDGTRSGRPGIAHSHQRS